MQKKDGFEDEMRKRKGKVQKKPQLSFSFTDVPYREDFNAVSAVPSLLAIATVFHVPPSMVHRGWEGD